MDNEAYLAVERMKGYIREHLQTRLTANDLARAAGYSQYHAARLFKAVTGLAPFAYIRRERLHASALALRAGADSVLSVALDFVFDSQEGFTRAFTSSFGISPGRYARQRPSGWLVPMRIRERATHEKEKTMEKTAVIFTQVVSRPARKLILHRSQAAGDYFAYCEEVGCEENKDPAQWDTLGTIREALYEPVGLWLPDNMRREGTGEYGIGVEVPADYAGTLPEGFDMIDLPACQMMVFQGEPYDDEDFADAVGVCMERIEVFNPEVYGYRFAPELAPRMQLMPQGWRGYIEMQPVVEIKRP